MQKASFHLSLPCHSITKTQAIYVDTLRASRGRSTAQWLDIDLFGNQITFTVTSTFSFLFKSYKFEEATLPSFHFGVLVSAAKWNSLLNRVRDGSMELPVNTSFLQDKLVAHRFFFRAGPQWVSSGVQTLPKARRGLQPRHLIFLENGWRILHTKLRRE